MWTTCVAVISAMGPVHTTVIEKHKRKGHLRELGLDGDSNTMYLW